MKNLALQFISLCFIGLFLFTAVSKWVIYDVYVGDLNRSPLLAPISDILSILIPLTLIALSVLLFIPKTQLWGLYGALGVMLMFTGYEIYVLYFAESQPCSCGGFFRNLSWPKQLLLTGIGSVLAITAIYLKTQISKTQNTVLPPGKYTLGDAVV